jgi:hypothetical protein
LLLVLLAGLQGSWLQQRLSGRDWFKECDFWCGVHVLILLSLVTLFRMAMICQIT